MNNRFIIKTMTIQVSGVEPSIQPNQFLHFPIAPSLPPLQFTPNKRGIVGIPIITRVSHHPQHCYWKETIQILNKSRQVLDWLNNENIASFGLGWDGMEEWVTYTPSTPSTLQSHPIPLLFIPELKHIIITIPLNLYWFIIPLTVFWRDPKSWTRREGS